MSKHLTLEDRIVIETQLSAGATPAEIAGILCKARSTIGREIRKHRQEQDTGAFGRVKNKCVRRRDCNLRGLCADKPNCARKCAVCSHCNTVCPDFLEEVCPKLARSPYVCNGCSERPKCVLRKFVCKARQADREYRSVLRENRQGFNLTTGEVKLIDQVVSPLIKNGQSIYHICANNRKGSRKEAKPDKLCRRGRTIEDFHLFIAQNPGCPHVEMDSVIGQTGGKVLLTLIFPKTEFMLAFLRDNNTAASVADCFATLYEGLGSEDFERLFPVLLTDNGTEFSNPKSIEIAPDGHCRSRIFYCNPMASYQKPHIERNHEFLCMVLPKGFPFDHLSQQDINLVLSHINSYKRPALGNKSPFEMFSFVYGERLTKKLLHLLCLSIIPGNHIILTPRAAPENFVNLYVLK